MMARKFKKRETPRPVAPGQGANSPNAKSFASDEVSLPHTLGSGNKCSRKRVRQRYRLRLRDGSEHQLEFSGKLARTLTALIDTRHGITAVEVSSWAFRLAAYVHVLRQNAIEIATEREEHPGGWHGRYFLLSDCSKVDVKEA